MRDDMGHDGQSEGGRVAAIRAAIAAGFRRRRPGPAAAGPAAAPARRWRAPATEAAWAALPVLTPNPRQMERERIVSFGKVHPAAVAFDVLRTRLMKLCRDNGWRRVAISSPTKGMGKSVVATNLALSLSRSDETRVVLIDLDLKLLGLRRIFGQREPRPIAEFLGGRKPAEAFLQRVGATLAVGVNSQPVRHSSELLQSATARDALAAVEQLYAPDLMILDLPPLLVSDDALALLPQVDAVLLVAAAGETTAKEIKACEALIGNACKLIGVILNKCRDDAADAYGYYGTYR
jgi:Mrp family chromosome partitioning ATPase